LVTPDMIIRTHRRSLSLTITKEGKFVVHAPKKLSVDEILKYIVEKEKWITSKQKEIQDKLNINKDVITYNEYLFLGKKYKYDFISGLKKIELSDKLFVIPSKIESNDINKYMKKWYVTNAKKILSDRLEYFADIMQLDYSTFNICNSKNRWGSCDSNRNIKLNFRLIMLPHKVIDYVIIHELSHIVELNHSKSFYKIISTIMPSYKLQQKILKEYDYVLRLFR